MDNLSAIQLIHFVPVLTTILSVIFATKIIQRWRSKPEALYLLWWGLGVAVYGAGTLVESINTLFGWSVVTFKVWYIAGALLGGAPLAIGTIYLLIGKRIGHMAVGLLTVTVAVTSYFVIMSPINMAMVDPNVLNSKVLGWQKIRVVSPFVNGLAGIFLIGGAIYSAVQYRFKPALHNRYIGNIFIAIGAILPGIGGSFSRMGYTEVLYVGEFLGLILIWYGYAYCQRPAFVAEPVAVQS